MWHLFITPCGYFVATLSVSAGTNVSPGSNVSAGIAHFTLFLGVFPYFSMTYAIVEPSGWGSGGRRFKSSRPDL